MTHKLPFYTLVLLISFASVNAVLFTPALPNIASFFNISESVASQTVSLFLIGYTIGQLIYSPFANRFGRKVALYAGISIQIVGSIACIVSASIKDYNCLVIGRFLLAIGSGVGLKMTFTLVNECFEAKIASQKISYLMLIWAITPGLGIMLGGFLTSIYGWQSCFYACLAYGLLLMLLSSKLPETSQSLDYTALNFKKLTGSYIKAFKNYHLVIGGLMMGCCTSFVYVFASIAPFIAIKQLNLNSSQYGIANVIPPIGLMLGSLASIKLAQKYSLLTIIKFGMGISLIGVIVFYLGILNTQYMIFSLFGATFIIYFGLSYILPNCSSIAMSNVTDKSYGAAIMSFINMAFATIIVLGLSIVDLSSLVLFNIYAVLCIAMIVLYLLFTKSAKG